MRRTIYFILALLSLALLSACGDTAQQSKTSTMKAVIKPSALTAGLNVAGVYLTITLPPGVAPPLLADGTADPAATVEITSASAPSYLLPGATYSPATTTASAQLAISATVASGFAATDQITIHLKVAAGAVPVESDFKLLSFDAFDINGALVTGLTPILSTTIL